MVLTLTVLLSLAAAPPRSTGADLLRAWVSGRTVPQASPHAADALAYEACQTSVALSSEASPEELAALRKDLERTLQSESEAVGVRERAAMLLGWLHPTEALPALATASARGPESLRAAAINALRFYGDREVKIGFTVFSSQFVTQKIGPNPQPRATAALVLASRDPSAALRRAAFTALADHHGPSVQAAALEAASAGRDGDTVIPLLVHPQVEGAEALFTRYTRDASAEVRAAAATGLGKIGADSARGRLVELLEDPDDRVFAAAHTALRHLEGWFGDMPPESARDRALLRPLWRGKLKL